jgi:SAM-dependent methyltransferase
MYLAIYESFAMKNLLLRLIPAQSGRVAALPLVALAAALLTSACGTLPTSTASTAPPAISAFAAKTSTEASALRPFNTSAVALEFLSAATVTATTAISVLPPQASRVVYTDAKQRRSVSAAQFNAMKPAEREGFAAVSHDEAFYYATFYGTPVAYVRALEVAGIHGLATLYQARVLDIGYGAMGGPRLMAGAGAAVAAIDVDSLLPALYTEAADQGAVAAIDGRTGNVRLYDGVFAGGTTVTKLLGNNFNLIVSKNTMKRGFMKPANGRPPFVSFDASDEIVLETIYDSLAPGGLLVIYNISAAFDEKKPSTDPRSPFTAAQFAKANLTVLALDVSDDVAVRSMGKALGWDAQMGDLEKNLFARYTVVRRAR